MTPVTASIIALALHALAVLPILFMALRPDLSARLAAPSIAFLLILATFQTGIFHRGGLASFDVEHLRSQQLEDRCPQIIAALGEQGLIVEPPAEGRLTVRAAVWDELPVAAKSVIIGCLEEGADEETTKWEIIKT